MTTFLGAHGYEPGPTQQPALAGAIAGSVATAPAILLLDAFGSLGVEAEILGMTVAATVIAGAAVMAAAGAVYARLFGRAALDRRGGWLFGMAYGFLLWAAGAVLVLPIASGGRAAAGVPALGLFVSLVIWGGALGALLPLVHRPLLKSVKSQAHRRASGPEGRLPKSRRWQDD